MSFLLSGDVHGKILWDNSFRPPRAIKRVSGIWNTVISKKTIQNCLCKYVTRGDEGICLYQWSADSKSELVQEAPISLTVDKNGNEVPWEGFHPQDLHMDFIAVFLRASGEDHSFSAEYLSELNQPLVDIVYPLKDQSITRDSLLGNPSSSITEWINEQLDSSSGDFLFIDNN